MALRTTLETGPTDNYKHPPHGAFTLLELIVVLALIGAVLAISGPSLRGFFESRQTSDAAVRVLVMARWCQSDAMAHGRRCRLNVDARSAVCSITVERANVFESPAGEAGQPYQLPQGATAGLKTALADPQPSFVQFYPSGRHDVATIEVRSADGRTYLVSSGAPTEAFSVASASEGAKP